MDRNRYFFENFISSHVWLEIFATSRSCSKRWKSFEDTFAVFSFFLKINHSFGTFEARSDRFLSISNSTLRSFRIDDDRSMAEERSFFFFLSFLHGKKTNVVVICLDYFLMDRLCLIEY